MDSLELSSIEELSKELSYLLELKDDVLVEEQADINNALMRENALNKGNFFI